MRKLRKLKNNFLMFWHGLLYGLKDADTRIMQQISNKKYDDSEITQNKIIGGVFADYLNQKETQQIKEMRDSYYRILREADKFIVTTTFDEVNDEYRATARRKDSSFQEKHVIIDESDNLPIKLIQFNSIIEEGVHKTMENCSYDNNESNAKYLIEIDREGITPRFRLEKYIKKIVLKRTNKEDKYVLDIYCSIYPRQFNKVDALFINEMRRVMDKKLYTNDTVYFDKLSFTTYKAYNIDDLYYFELNKVKLKDISIFDGNFVLKYDVNAYINGLDLTEKYKTKEMDEKYATNAPKGDTISLDLAERIIQNS